MKGWKTIFLENGNQKRAGMVLPISDTTDFKPKTVARVKGEQ